MYWETEMGNRAMHSPERGVGTGASWGLSHQGMGQWVQEAARGMTQGWGTHLPHKEGCAQGAPTVAGPVDTSK